MTLSLAIVTVVSLGTLAVVASVHDVDALSTIALALAVLAFAAQLIISLGQASAGAQQISQSERINTETKAALAELRATSDSLLANQKDLIGHLLRAAIPEIARDLSSDPQGGIGTPSGVADMATRLELAVTKALKDTPLSWRGYRPDPFAMASVILQKDGQAAGWQSSMPVGGRDWEITFKQGRPSPEALEDLRDYAKSAGLNLTIKMEPTQDSID
ncbi:MAG: hypothetical protein ACJ72N_24035 [Labedaea sp.]